MSDLCCLCTYFNLKCPLVDLKYLMVDIIASIRRLGKIGNLNLSHACCLPYSLDYRPRLVPGLIDLSPLTEAMHLDIPLTCISEVLRMQDGKCHSTGSRFDLFTIGFEVLNLGTS